MTVRGRRPWRQALRRESPWFLLFAAGPFIAVMLGADPMRAVLIGLGLYAAWHLWQAVRLFDYLLGGGEVPADRVWGLWREVFSQLQRFRKREHRRRRRQQKVMTRIRKMAEAMPDALVTLSGSGEIGWFNQQARTYFGLYGDPVVGRRLVDLVAHPVLHDYLSSGEFGRGLEIEAPGDPTIVLAVNVARFKKGRERYLLVARDITRQYLLNRTQRDFTLNVSHELKTPLTVLRGYLETLADAEDEQSPRRMPLLRMHDQVSRMQGVILDLFTLSRLEYGSEELERESVEVFAMLEDVLVEMRMLAENSHHVLKLSGDPEVQLRGDASLLRCAFSNLVSNAIQHTPSRTQVEICWSLKGDQAELLVRDNGAGIPSRHLPRLTERFYRVDAGRSRDAGGTGLGLAIVQQILDLHGAQLSIRSEEGRGAEFRCLFPAQMVETLPVEPRVGGLSRS